MATPTVVLDPELAPVIAAVQADLLELVEGLERHGGIYARDYIIAALEAPRGRRMTSRTPRRPPELAPLAAGCVKELALDHLAAHRRSGEDRRSGEERRECAA